MLRLRNRKTTILQATLGLVGAAALLLGAALTSVPRAQAQVPDGAPLTLTFGPGRDGVQAGTITFTSVSSSQTRVNIDVAPGAAGVEQPAHIHTGGCPGVGAVKYPLTNVVGGKSVTTVDVARNSLFDGTFSANVHKGPGADSQIYTACVNLPARQNGSGGGGGGGPQTRPTAGLPGVPATGTGPGPARSFDFAGIAFAAPSMVDRSSALTLSSAGFAPGAMVTLTIYDGQGRPYAYQQAGQAATLSAADDGSVTVSIVPAEQVDAAAGPGFWTAVFQDTETGYTSSATFQVTR